MSSPEATRAIKLLKEVELSVKSELGQRVKWAVVEALREKWRCPVCELRKLDPTPPK